MLVQLDSLSDREECISEARRIGWREVNLANMSLEALDAVATEDKPDLERAEAAAEAEVPISVVDHEPCV